MTEAKITRLERFKVQPGTLRSQICLEQGPWETLIPHGLVSSQTPQFSSIAQGYSCQILIASDGDKKYKEQKEERNLSLNTEHNHGL